MSDVFPTKQHNVLITLGTLALGLTDFSLIESFCGTDIRPPSPTQTLFDVIHPALVSMHTLTRDWAFYCSLNLFWVNVTRAFWAHYLICLGVKGVGACKGWSQAWVAHCDDLILIATTSLVTIGCPLLPPTGTKKEVPNTTEGLKKVWLFNHQQYLIILGRYCCLKAKKVLGLNPGVFLYMLSPCLLWVIRLPKALIH